MEKLFLEIHTIKSVQLVSGPLAVMLSTGPIPWHNLVYIPAGPLREGTFSREIGEVTQISDEGDFGLFSIYHCIPVHSIPETEPDSQKRRESLVDSIRRAFISVPEKAALPKGIGCIPRLVVANISRVPTHYNAAFEEPVWPDPSDSFLEPSLRRLDLFVGGQKEGDLRRRGVEEQAFALLKGKIRYCPRHLGSKRESLGDLEFGILSALERKGLFS